MHLYHSCKRRPCHPYAKINGPIRTSLPQCHPYTKMDGLISFLYAATLPPIRQYGRTNQKITTSMPAHTPKWMDLYHLARDCHDTHSSKWTGIRTSLLLCHPYAKMDGSMPFFHATAMPPIRHNGLKNQNITTSMPPLR
jgi:hypothetical protein